MATYVFFGVGDYEYSNNVNLYDNRAVGVRVKASIRDTVESGLSAIPSTVTYNGVTYTVKSLHAYYPPSGTAYGTWDGTNIGPYGGAFQGCKKLTSVPTFPSTIDYTIPTATWDLFRMCHALTNPPALPSGVTRMSNTYSYCPITTAPAIPNTATELVGVFWGCKQLVNAPTIPPSVTNLDTTFASCTALETAPEIPASVTKMRNCFSGCTSLKGNIVVNNQITEEYDYRNVFYNTVNDIYIINGGTAGSVWKDAIAPSYSNVHYEADDHPAPSLSSFSATRVASNGSTTPAEKGLWVYLSAQANISTEYLPVGWASEFGSTTTTMDDDPSTPAWTVSASTGTITLTAWVNINDLSAHTFTLSISELIKEGATTKKTLTTATLTATVPKAYALVDYYHDPVTGTEGFAVGKYAEHADLFDVAMPTSFLDMTAQEIDDFVDSIGGGGEPVADVVVDVGTDGIWNYRKWESGKYEAWAFSSTSATHYVTFAGWYGYYVDLALSSFMLTKDNLFITCPLSSGTQFCMPTGYVISSSGLRAYCCSAGSGTQTIMFNLLMIGRWK